MRVDILLVGQGIAGTLLAWEFERAGISFAIADAGESVPATSRVAAGMVNPITGRRLVKSWAIDALLPAARATYRELGDALGVGLWRELRVRRIFQDERERRVAREKHGRGELSPYVVAAPDDTGLWIECAARVDVAALIDAAKARWSARGSFRSGSIDVVSETERHDLVIDCRGVSGARDALWSGVPWEFSKGEILAITAEDLALDVVLNRGHWLLPVSRGEAWVGATHEPGAFDSAPSGEARVALEASAAGLLDGRDFEVTRQFAGVRVNLPDKRPVAGRHFSFPRLGVLNGLGAKGVLLAPTLARQWVNHLTEGVRFDPEIDVARFDR